MMKRVLILAEGPTENDFVKRVLAPYLAMKNIHAISTMNTTKRVLAGPNFKGGDIRYSRVVKELRLLLNDTGAAAVTTLVDYYGFRFDFPAAPPNPSAAEIEGQLVKELDHPRFIPHLQVHEFEALLFAAPDVLSTVLDAPAKRPTIEGILEQCGAPEDINNDPATAPSKRLLEIFPSYNKRIDGVRVLEKVGIPAIRAKCPKFNGWLTTIENL